MSKILYLECYSGISGDMTVAALLDLGADQQVLEAALKSLTTTGFEIVISRVKKAGLDVCDFQVILDHDNHDHDMAYLHGEHHHHHGEKQGHSHNVSEPSHHHEYQEQKSHSHANRGLSDIVEIINQAAITERARELAIRIFSIIAIAEAKAHGVEKDLVHFHEVGAVDSIVDIVAVAVCLDNLDIREVIVPEVYEGRGFVRCQHGTIPIPVPAVTHIAANHHLNLHITSTVGELITPTGAAIVAAIKTSDQLPKQFTIEKTGIGAGKRTYDRPSLLRAMLITDKTQKHDGLYKLESNIDDCGGEILGFVMERLFEAGARDVHYIPVYMKKNRPAYQLNVICNKAHIENLEQIIFEETTTIGIRRFQMESTGLKRTVKSIKTSLGKAQVKVCELASGKRVYPEYASVVELCEKHRMAYQDAYHIIKTECEVVEEMVRMDLAVGIS
ncbi:nickel pincer cofactor biosynthesis protein LarC [Acetobacterium wieringae]|uniref:Pyridinium-3,5-bisthiocarboxylic acid mononucleotide nickel insertion protein n=1 Tax=Acetobacterium wieringae TaxID=52694 RepID=A0ABY6HLP3_9FIRM|nr:nickel pincer cofactor biosynthesis protein LarC [Acetobacterium wieringae]UYO64339.1 nickel pincer cofactor biosynthesis protein LarC [Acetobacterium wieringae]VUZ27103.1 Pyridinium-3,5-bisthiocarboxylic acid mononucleotide nickel insertion protein [Acetobacterium wieringae]